MWDANNLYGHALSTELPKNTIIWLTNEEIHNFDIKTAGGNGTGYILEVDFKYNESLHTIHDLYPLCHQKLKVTDDMMSNYLKNLKFHGVKHSSKIEKLIPNLRDKKNI